MNGFTWSGWGGSTVTGQGTLYYYRCPAGDPDCTSGGVYAPYQAVVTLTGLVPVDRRYSAYAQMRVSAPAAPQPTFTFSRALVP